MVSRRRTLSLTTSSWKSRAFLSASYLLTFLPFSLPLSPPFSSCFQISAQACYAIAACAFVKEMRDKLTAEGAAEFVAHALKSFPNDKQIAEKACFAVTNLCAGSGGTYM